MKKLILLMAILGIVLAGCANKSPILPVPTAPQKAVEPAPAVATGELGLQAFQKGDYEGAVEHYSDQLQANPQDTLALFYRGRAYMQLGQHDYALQDFSQLNDLTGKVYQTRILIILDRGSEAEKILESVLSDPEFAKMSAYDMFTAYYMDGQLKNSAGQFDRAMKSLDDAIQVFDRNLREFAQVGSPYIGRFAYYHRAVAFHMLGRQQQAASDMEKYIDLSQKANAEVTSKDYKSLVLALYLSENLTKCREYVGKLSEEDRKDLSQRFHNDSVFSK